MPSLCSMIVNDPFSGLILLNMPSVRAKRAFLLCLRNVGFNKWKAADKRPRLSP